MNCFDPSDLRLPEVDLPVYHFNLPAGVIADIYRINYSELPHSLSRKDGRFPRFLVRVGELE